ncbi:MAG: alpha-L-fucosidase [Phycisphaerales bacterium]
MPYVRAQVAEVIKDVDPDVLWFDGEWEDTWTEQNGIDLYNEIRGLKPSIIINNRVGKSRNDMQGFTKKGTKAVGDFCTPEQEVPATGLPGVAWETCMTMNNSWGFKSSDHEWKSATQIVRTLCDVASKGGNFLLNVGPKPDGTIPQESIDRLHEVGRWMSLNGEAIYGTHASPFKKLPWGRATQKNGPDGKTTLYLMVFDWPETGDLALPGLSPLPTSARVLTLDKMLRHVQITQGKDGVQLSGLGKRPAGTGDKPVVVRVDFNGPATVLVPPPPAIPAWQGGVYTLTAEQAEIDGSSLRLQGEGNRKNLGYWTNNSDKTFWNVKDLRGAATASRSCSPASPQTQGASSKSLWATRSSKALCPTPARGTTSRPSRSTDSISPATSPSPVSRSALRATSKAGS